MATLKHAIEEHDVVALRVPIGTWPTGTRGTAVGLYDGAALVEVAEDDPPGSALDNLVKGASGQAIQCANATMSLSETAGLPTAGLYP